MALRVLFIVLVATVVLALDQKGVPPEMRIFSLDEVNLNVLTLASSAWTKPVRGKLHPQLECRGDPLLCAKHKQRIVRCSTLGPDEWNCIPDDNDKLMDAGLRWASQEVTCDGISSPEDRIARVGSCSLVYTLEKTHVKEREPVPLQAARWNIYLLVAVMLLFGIWRLVTLVHTHVHPVPSANPKKQQ
jgi:hypothetical protein